MNVSKYLLSTLILSMILFVGCDESDDIQKYEQEALTVSGNPLSYTNFTSYPVVGDIESSAPAGDFDAPYRFRLLNASSTTGSSFTKAAFTVDPDSGAITYGNAANTISTGVYSVDIGISNSNGMAVHEGAYILTILDVPVLVNIDAAQVNAGIFEQGVMATVSYTDTSASGSEVTSVSYALIEPPVGFSINATTGAISKGNGAVSGPNQLSVQVTTNTGIIIVQNILTGVQCPWEHGRMSNRYFLQHFHKIKRLHFKPLLLPPCSLSGHYIRMDQIHATMDFILILLQNWPITDAAYTNQRRRSICERS